MRRELPADIEVSTPSGGDFQETHYRLPRRSLPGVKTSAMGGLLAAIVLSSIPLLFAAFFAIATRGERSDFRLTAILMPIIFFGSFLFPLAGFILWRTTFNYFGRVEVVCQRNRILVSHRCGPMWWTCRLPHAGLKGFRVKWGTMTDEKGQSVAPDLYELATLVADYQGGHSKTLCHGYAPDWLEAFARDLTERCEAYSKQMPSLSLVTRMNEDPTVIGPRFEQPSTSTVRVEMQKDRLVIDIPPRGWEQSVPLFFKFFCISWNLFIGVFCTFFIPMLLAGEVKWEDGPEKTPIWLGLLITLPFLLVGSGMIAYWWAAAMINARLEFSGDQLLVEEVSFIGKTSRNWKRCELRGVRAISKASRDEGAVTWTYVLQIEPLQGPSYEMLAFLDSKSEIEWLATILSNAMGLAQSVPNDSD